MVRSEEATSLCQVPSQLVQALMDLEIRAETMAKSFDSTSISPQNHGMITVNTRQEVKRVTIKPTMKHLIPENIYDVKDRRKISVVVRHK